MKGRQSYPIDQHHLWLRGGVWQVRYQLPLSLGGRRIAFSTGTSDLRDAADIRDRLLAPILNEDRVADFGRKVLAATRNADDSITAMVNGAGSPFANSVPTGPTLRQAAVRFLENRRSFKQRSGHTIDDYGRTLQAVEYILGNVRLNQITTKHLREIRDRLLVVGRFWCRGKKPDLTAVQPEHRLTPRTVVKNLKNFSTFLSWAVKEELIEKNPASHLDLPSTQRNPTRPPSTSIADKLCTLPYPSSPTIGQIEWEVLPYFYRYTGARCGEICQLEATDVVIVDGIRCMRILTEKTGTRGGKTQTEAKRLVPVHPLLAPHLDRLIEHDGGNPKAKLFQKVGSRYIKSGDFIRHGYGWSNLYNRKAKEIWEPMHVHCWRSYAITEMARAGVAEEVRRRVVGHAVISVHEGYTHVDVMRLKQAVESIP